MLATSETTIPPELRRKISPGLLMFTGGNGRAFRNLQIGLAVLSLYGPLQIYTDHNVFLYLLGPWVCFSVAALIWSSLPHRPYRGLFYQKSQRDIDTDDPAVMRLVELYKSDEIRHHLGNATLKLSGVVFAILGLAAYLLRNSLSWTFPSPHNHFQGSAGDGFWVRLAMGTLFALLALWSDCTGWCLTTWARREIASHGNVSIHGRMAAS
jgi:hypothetical protein